MTPAAMVVAVIPPIFAILVETFNPVSERLIRESAIRDLEPFETSANHKHLIDNATKLTVGAVEVSGLAPTLVASVTSGFGVLYEVPYPWLIMAYVLAFVALVLVILRFLGGQSFLSIETRRQEQKIFRWSFTPTRTGSEIVSFVIYLANVLLLAFVLLTYCILDPPWHYFSAFAALIRNLF